MKLGDEILELNPMRWIEENLFMYEVNVSTVNLRCLSFH